MTNIGPERDEALGAVLGARLDEGADNVSLALRIKEALAALPLESGVDVLARWWARPGLVAAACLVAGVALWVALASKPPSLAEEALLPSQERIVASAVGMR